MPFSLALPRRLRAPFYAAFALCAGLCGSPAQSAEPALGYVSNQHGDVTVIDLGTMKVSGSINAYGKEPRGLGVTADGKLLVVANRVGGRVSIIDRHTGKLLRRVHVGANPEFVRTRGHMAFVTFEPSSTGKPPPRPAAASAPPAAHEDKPDGDHAEGKDDDDDNKEPAHIAIVDLDRGKLLRTIVGGLETEGIEFAVDGKHILVTNEADNTVTLHDIATGKLVKTIDVKPYGERPRGVKLSPDGKQYVVTLEFGNAFVVLDDNLQVVKTVKTGESPYGVAFDSAGDRLFIATSRSKKLQVFDAHTYALLEEVPTGDRCWHFSFTPDGKQIMVVCGRSNEVVVVDAASLKVTGRIPDKKLPWGIVTWPKAMGSLDQPE